MYEFTSNMFSKMLKKKNERTTAYRVTVNNAETNFNLRQNATVVFWIFFVVYQQFLYVFVVFV